MILSVLIAIASVFLIIVIVQQQMKRKFCAICAAVSLTMASLLGWYWISGKGDPILLGILLGQSILGLFYLAEHYAPKPLLVYRLPFLLALTALGYALITRSFPQDAFMFLIAVVFLFGAVHVLRIPAARKLTKNIIECCKRW